ncbi:MAG: TetR/AcrR family transcriptional regulator [Deltaproteobacteria bacterium]|nr:TetR/AcrR family transcriptional regulator [Deltaproteobacteria bacterium]
MSKDPDPRQSAILEAAFGVFLHYGFRKTSMEEVARAAEISRQGLYLHFATKEELFRATVEHGVGKLYASAVAGLADKKRPIADRLVMALDAWTGRFVGVMGPGASDLADVSKSLVGDLIGEYEARFLLALSKAIGASELKAAYQPAKLTPKQLSETLLATARGLKYGSTSRAAFVAAIEVAVRALCAPIGGSR